MSGTKKHAPHDYKYSAALGYIIGHPDIVPPRSKWRLMAPESLYAFLGVRGIVYSDKERCWEKYLGDFAAPAIARKLQGTVAIRITADRDEMDSVLSEFTELCEAIDWRVQISPRRYDNIDGRTQRVYVEVIRDV